jgi:rRNA maturation endonuclease Nob1
MTSPTVLTALVAVAVLALGFAGIAIRLLANKDAEFRGTCATNNQALKERGVECEVCGGDADKCASSQNTQKEEPQREHPVRQGI